MSKWIPFAFFALLVSHATHAEEPLRIVGSSTVFPFVAAAAEQFGRADHYRTPIVEINGTGGGFKMFCDGAGESYADIANASRPIKEGERARCRARGVHAIHEFKIGYDGIVIANAKESPAMHLTKQQIFLALARQVPRQGKLVNNPYTRWNELDASLPDMPIEVYGPPPAEGTRDAFVEMVMHEACHAFAEYAVHYPQESVRKNQCGQMREDGRFVELLGGNVMVQKLVNNRQALGIFSYSFLDQNRAQVKANSVGGVAPVLSAIVSGRYPIARSLFIYAKGEHLAQRPALAAFVRFLLSDAAVGEDGFLVVKGLIPMTDSERRTMQKAAEAMR